MWTLNNGVDASQGGDFKKKEGFEAKKFDFLTSMC